MPYLSRHVDIVNEDAYCMLDDDQSRLWYASVKGRNAGQDGTTAKKDLVVAVRF